MKQEVDIARIIEKIEINNEYSKELILAMPLIEWSRFEWAIEKAVELGATKIIPFKSDYCNYDESFFNRKKEKFEKIMLSASQQSFRNNLTILENVINFKDIFKLDKKVYLSDSEINQSQKASDYIELNSILVVGPEGGFTQNEIDFAKTNNATIISLGKRILRSETAALKMLSLVKE